MISVLFVFCSAKWHDNYDPFHYRVNITYINKDGDRTSIKGKIGDNILYLAHRYNINMEGKKNYSTIVYG